MYSSMQHTALFACRSCSLLANDRPIACAVAFALAVSLAAAAVWARQHDMSTVDTHNYIFTISCVRIRADGIMFHLFFFSLSFPFCFYRKNVMKFGAAYLDIFELKMKSSIEICLQIHSTRSLYWWCNNNNKQINLLELYRWFFEKIETNHILLLDDGSSAMGHYLVNAKSILLP